MSKIKPNLIIEKPLRGQTGIGKAFELFIKETDLTFTKIKTW